MSGPSFTMDITLAENKKTQVVRLPLDQFLSAEEYQASFEAPICLEDLDTNKKANPSKINTNRVWLFRDAIYCAERPPRQSEIEKEILRIKAPQFQEDDALKRLRDLSSSRFVSSLWRSLPDAPVNETCLINTNPSLAASRHGVEAHNSCGLRSLTSIRHELSAV